MAGQIKRLFELDAEHPAPESESIIDNSMLTPHLGVARSVKQAFQRLVAGKFRAVDFLAGKRVIIYMSLILIHLVALFRPN